MPDPLLLVAHGSRSQRSQAEMSQLASEVAKAYGSSKVTLGYLELCRPSATEALEELLRDGAKRVVVVPVMLHSAGHSKSDVPAVVAGARARHPDREIVYARPFGADHSLLSLGARRVRQAGGRGLPLAVISRGSSDPDANAEAYRVGRLLADMVGSRTVASGFSGITWPTVEEALDELRRLGARRIACFAWYLTTGVLIDRMKLEFDRFARDTRTEVVDCGYLGAGPEVSALVVSRVEEALTGRAVPNCDACAYRVPFPGMEDRVGLAIGTGHSHLAASHRSGHEHH